MCVRIASLLSLVFALSCAAPISYGPLDGGSTSYPSIAAVDSAHPPKSVSVKIDGDAYVVVILVAPGHSATLLFPSDSTTDNKRASGTHDIAFEIPRRLVRGDSSVRRQDANTRASYDSANRNTTRIRNRQTPSALPPLPATTATYLLVVTSPRQLTYLNVLEKTAGVSIPLGDMEALNAIGKAVKNTIPTEPKDWAAYYQLVEISRGQ
jgi:hypothetical protein